ncbi:MAG: hypothetical protein AAGA30_05905 [Planctomycetota bacterium]
MESRNNPYLTPNHESGAESGWRRGSMFALARKVILTCVWTIAFVFGSAMLLGFASGIYFSTMSFTTGGPSQQTMERIGLAWAVAPLLLGAIGILMSVLGWLPGTRWKE